MAKNTSGKISLPSGAWVVLRDPATLKVGDRKKIMTAPDGVEGETAKAIALGDAILAMLIEEWSLDLIIPRIRPASLDEMEIVDYDTLTEHSREVQKHLFPHLAETPESQADPDSPFDNSNDSNG